MNNDQQYNIRTKKDYEKYAFEYYLISQMSSKIDYVLSQTNCKWMGISNEEQFNYNNQYQQIYQNKQIEDLLNDKDESIFSLETLIVYQNKTNQAKREIPSALKNFEKWSFPRGIKLVQESDPRYKSIDDFYNDPQAKLGSQIHEINYFVVTDLTTLQKYYCTSAYFYEKIIIVDKSDKPYQFYVPKSHIILSCATFFSCQKSFMGYLLQIHRMKQFSSDQSKIVQVNQNGNIYGIEQTKLFEYYIQYTYDNCLITEANEKVNLKLNGNDKFLTYCTKNNINNTFYSLVNPSNIFFESIIFGQSPYSLLCLLTYIILEYQIILVSRKTNSLTLFAENILDLIKPLIWRGVYIPHLVVQSMFDYENSKLPYIIGINRKDYKIPEQDKNLSSELLPNRIVYDIDENNFIYINEKQPLKAPLVYRNYFMRKINLIVGDIKFYEEEYYSQAILRFKQFFYNFILLLFHDLLDYFSKPNADVCSKKTSINETWVTSTRADPLTMTASSNNFQKSLNFIDHQSNCGTSNNSFLANQVKQVTPIKKEANLTSVQQIQASAKKKIVYFNYKKYIACFQEKDQPFFQTVTKTLVFNGLIKDCFRAIEFRDEFLEQERKKQFDYSFGSIFCFIDDVKFLGNRAPSQGISASLYTNNTGAETNLINTTVSLNDKIKELEDIQHQQVAELLTGNLFTDVNLNADDGVAEYLERIFRINSKSDSNDKTPSSNQISSYLSSFLNNPLDLNKEIIHQTSFDNQNKKIVQSNINPFENFKEENGLQSQEQFYKQYSIDKKKRCMSDQKENAAVLNGKILSEFNEELWQIPTLTQDEIKSDLNIQNLNIINKNKINGLSLLNKKNRLISYQQQDEDEQIQKRYQHKLDGSSTMIEVHSVCSAHPNKLSHKNSFKEFTKITNEFNLLQTLKNQNNTFKSQSSISPSPEDLLLLSQEK